MVHAVSSSSLKAPPRPRAPNAPLSLSCPVLPRRRQSTEPRLAQKDLAPLQPLNQEAWTNTKEYHILKNPSEAHLTLGGQALC